MEMPGLFRNTFTTDEVIGVNEYFKLIKDKSDSVSKDYAEV